jgi:hypothetical protein
MYHNDLPDMSEALRQVYEKKQLDSVGAEDKDIDNDGDHDKTDSYLLNRRKKVTKAMGKKTHICAKLVGYKKEEWETIPEMHTMLEDGTVTHYDIMREGVIRHNVPVEELDILISEKHEHFDNYAKNAQMLEGVRDTDPEKGTAERKARLEKKRGMKLDDHPQYKKEDVEQVDEADSLAAMAARREKRLQAQRKKMGKSAAGHDFGHDYGMTAAQRKAQQDKEFKAFLGRKEAFAFSESELEELALLEEIDAMTDEQLIDMMEDLIIETAEDIDDLIEICEHLESVEVLTERMDPKEIQRRRDQAKDRLETGAAMKRAAEKSSAPSRMDRLKSAAKSAGSRLKAGAERAGAAAKKGIKAAGKSAAASAGKAVGTFQANRIKAKRAEMSKKSSTSSSSSSSDSDDDGTGGKLDALLAKTRGTSSSSSSDSGSSSSGGGGSSSSSSSSGSTRKAVGGALRKVGSLVKKGLKKAVGKTARVVSSGSDKLAKRLGEDYDQIVDMYESGIFTIEEIENVVELYKGKHGQTAKQYADSRSQGGKMVSGDSKMSGAEYTHGRRVKAANPGMQPDVGGKTKPKSQGKMDAGTRADLQYRKANLKKKD